MTTQITFHGAAGTVTGSSYRVEHAAGTFLVDCGMFQGNRTLRELNWRPFPFDPGSLDALIVTHAHIDHAGLVPRLPHEGFDGPIHATRPTRDLMSFLLPDSARIVESDVERTNRKRERQGRAPVEPSYTVEDAEAALALTRTHPYQEWFEPAPGVRARFWNAGHILGSASVEVEVASSAGAPVRILFSGDLGPDEKAFHPDPEAPRGFDYVLCESTYGGREREDASLEQRRKTLCAEIRGALGRGGNLVIPAFAVERSQELLHDIGTLLAAGEIPNVPVFLDSPLARKVTSVFVQHAGLLEEVEVDEEELFRHPSFRIVESVEESKSIKDVAGGAIILSASGMCDAGRIKHHLRNNLWRSDSTVLFVGYQAPGTLGHILMKGAQRVRIHGRHVEVKATVRRIGNYSAHADQGELVAWIRERLPASGGIFLTHGEQKQRAILRDKLIESGLDPEAILLPGLDESFELRAGAGAAIAATRGRERIAPEALERDWYNDYAALILRFGRRLEELPDSAARRDLIGRVERAIQQP